MIAFLATVTSITKPELFYWKLCLVSQNTAVFTPYTVILITVTAKTGVCTRVGHPACALTISRCSSLVRHLCRVTWYPPSKSAVYEYPRMVTLVLDKLFTVCGNYGETGQLRQASSSVVNCTWVTPSSFASLHVPPALTVMTDDCHANTLLASHVTVHCEWCQSSLAIWINHIVSATADVVPDFRAGSWFWLNTVTSISNVPRLAFAWIGSTFIDTWSAKVTIVCLSFTLIKI